MDSSEYMKKLMFDLRTEHDVNKIKRRIITINDKIAQFPVGKAALDQVNEKMCKDIINQYKKETKEILLNSKLKLLSLKKEKIENEKRYAAIQNIIKNYKKEMAHQISELVSEVKLASIHANIPKKTKAMEALTAIATKPFELPKPKKSKAIVALDKIPEPKIKKSRGRPKKQEEVVV